MESQLGCSTSLTTERNKPHILWCFVIVSQVNYRNTPQEGFVYGTYHEIETEARHLQSHKDFFTFLLLHTHVFKLLSSSAFVFLPSKNSLLVNEFGVWQKYCQVQRVTIAMSFLMENQ